MCLASQFSPQADAFFERTGSFMIGVVVVLSLCSALLTVPPLPRAIRALKRYLSSKPIETAAVQLWVSPAHRRRFYMVTWIICLPNCGMLTLSILIFGVCGLQALVTEGPTPQGVVARARLISRGCYCAGGLDHGSTRQPFGVAARSFELSWSAALRARWSFSSARQHLLSK
jgi:hypothetical protein